MSTGPTLPLLDDVEVEDELLLVLDEVEVVLELDDVEVEDELLLVLDEVEVEDELVLELDEVEDELVLELDEPPVPPVPLELDEVEVEDELVLELAAMPPVPAICPPVPGRRFSPAAHEVSTTTPEKRSKPRLATRVTEKARPRPPAPQRLRCAGRSRGPA